MTLTAIIQAGYLSNDSGWFVGADMRTDTGKIKFKIDNYRQPNEVITAEWEGPPTIRISDQLMTSHDERYWKQDGDILTICQYKLRLTGKRGIDYFIAERIDE